MANYVIPLPIDKNDTKLQEFPAAVKARTVFISDNGVASSVASLNPNTTSLEVSAFGGQGAVIRWVPLTETASVSPFASVVASGLGANFDHHIPEGTMRRFAVPKETQGQGLGNHQIGSTFGLYQRVARVNAGATASSVIIAEF